MCMNKKQMTCIYIHVNINIYIYIGYVHLRLGRYRYDSQPPAVDADAVLRGSDGWSGALDEGYESSHCCTGTRFIPMRSVGWNVDIQRSMHDPDAVLLHHAREAGTSPTRPLQPGSTGIDRPTSTVPPQ